MTLFRLKCEDQKHKNKTKKQVVKKQDVKKTKADQKKVKSVAGMYQMQTVSRQVKILPAPAKPAVVTKNGGSKWQDRNCRLETAGSKLFPFHPSPPVLETGSNSILTGV